MKLLSIIEIYVKNRNFCQKSNLLSEIETFVKIETFVINRNFGEISPKNADFFLSVFLKTLLKAGDDLRYDREDPAVGVKQLTTGFSKWAARFLSQCSGQRNYS